MSLIQFWHTCSDFLNLIQSTCLSTASFISRAFFQFFSPVFTFSFSSPSFFTLSLLTLLTFEVCVAYLSSFAFIWTPVTRHETIGYIFSRRILWRTVYSHMTHILLGLTSLVHMGSTSIVILLYVFFHCAIYDSCLNKVLSTIVHNPDHSCASMPPCSPRFSSQDSQIILWCNIGGR